ncbi:MAG: hypothetical protein ACRED0_10310 [Gammaproteobacteria bacterium]
MHIYYYFMDREWGLIHIMIQTWFPMRMQVFVNGHHWVANKLEENGGRFTQCDNVFVWIEDIDRAQRFGESDRLGGLAGSIESPCAASQPADGVLAWENAILLGHSAM